MKQAIFALTLVAALSSFALGTMFGDGAGYDGNESYNNEAYGADALRSATGVKGGIYIGERAGMSSYESSDNIVIGRGALRNTPNVSGSVAIGHGEMVGEEWNNDTTSINSKQLWISGTHNAFCVNPMKRGNITNAPLYFVNGELHLNARRVIIGGEAIGLSTARVVKEPFKGMYIPYEDEIALTNGYAENNGSDKCRIWMTGVVSRVEYQLSFDSDTVVSARVHNVTIGHHWFKRYSGNVFEDDFGTTNDIVIPIAQDGRSFAKGKTVSHLSEDYFVGLYRKAFTVSTSADGTTATVRVYDGSVAPYQGDDMLTCTVKFPDPYSVRRAVVPVSQLADDRPIRGNVTNLITSAGVAEHCALNADVGLKRVDGYQFVSIYPQQAHVDETTGNSERLIYRIDVGITEAAAREIMEQQTPDSDGYYTATGFTHFRICGIRTFCGEGYYGKYVTYDWRTDSLYTQFEGEDSQIAFYIEPVNNSGYFGVSIREENVHTGSIIWSEDFHIPYPVMKFKPKDGIQYAADSTVSKSCLSTTKYVDNRLGGLSLKNENGAISVYSGGVKIGTLTLNPTP